jgi:hypothetical protein
VRLRISDIRKLVREELDRILEFDFSPYKGQTTEDDIISVGLDVTHRESGLDYTVKSVGMSDVQLLTPEGEVIVCTKDQLRKDYDVGVGMIEDDTEETTTEETSK